MKAQLLRRPASARAARARAGFTLIELMAVLVILALLMVILVTQFTNILGSSKESMTKVDLQHLQEAIHQYESEYGDYPPSSFTAAMGTPPNTTNVGSECLVVALYSKRFAGGGGGFENRMLVNTDADASRTKLTDFETLDLFELKDQWDNPIAYLHRADYGTPQVYVSFDPESGEELSTSVRALQNPDTKLFYRSDSFQLISAGPDGRFGTEDDIPCWERKP